MKMKTLNDLFVDQLKDLYSAENQLVKALPKMAKAASNPDLKAGIEQHLEETKQQAERIEQICEEVGVTPKGKKCAAMEGLIEEGKELMEEDAEPGVLDAGLIAAAQKVEHYEIASYGTLRTWAEQLGMDEAVKLIEQTLEEEKSTDQKLTELATAMVNEEADQGESEDDDADEKEDDDEEDEEDSEEQENASAKAGRRS